MRNSQAVSAWLEAELAAGRLGIGSRLPGERAMAEQLKVSRTSVREGIRVLEALGVLKAGVGSGPGAGTIVTANPAVALGSTLRLHIASSHLPVSDIVQTRLLLETWAAAQAKSDAVSLVAAENLLVDMDRPGIEAPDFLALDALFHVALAEAAGNILVGAMMASLRESIQAYTQRLTVDLPDWHATAVRLRDEHREILNAIRSGKGQLAADLVARHIEGFYREAGLQR